jgi:hypothetical protein
MFSIINMSIYLGKNSIMCKKEKVCVRSDNKPGITSCKEAKGIIRLIFRDLRRGWTYNQQGKKIRMTKKLAKSRILFLLKLAKLHHAPKKEFNCIKKEVSKALKVL